MQQQLFTSTCGYLSADIVSTVEFNHDGELLATGDKGGRIVIFQKEDAVSLESLTVDDQLLIDFVPCYVNVTDLFFPDSRKDHNIMANTTFTVLSKVTNQSSIILKVWRSRKKLTRSSG